MFVSIVTKSTPLAQDAWGLSNLMTSAALGKKYLSDVCECYSAGTETKPQINRDAVRLMKQVHGIDMEKEQFGWTGDWKTPQENRMKLFWK